MCDIETDMSINFLITEEFVSKVRDEIRGQLFKFDRVIFISLYTVKLAFVVTSVKQTFDFKCHF